MRLELPFRPAAKTDAPLLAELVNYAGEGLPLYLWEQYAGAGLTAWDIGRMRAERDEGSFSWRNAVVIEHQGQPAGCLIGYEIPAEPDPIPEDMPAMFRPLQELENLAPDTWYVNVLAVRPEFRSVGLGSRLLRLAEQTSLTAGRKGMSLIVSDANSGARRLYERCGYRAAASRPMVKEGWEHEGNKFVLMSKPF